MEFLVLLPPLFSSFTVSDNDNACEPQLCGFYDCTLYVNLLGYECGPVFSGVIGFQNSTSLPAYGFKGNSTSYTPFMSDSICFDMELPGLHTYVLVDLFGFSPCPVTYAIWYLHIKCFEVSKASIGLASFPSWIIWFWWSQRLHWVVKTTCMKCIMSSIIICLDRMQFWSHCFRGFWWSSEVFMDNSWKML